ncbi:MAG: DUF1963 domain-containing protein [Planctomycetaceae bacterium]|nr:DUF1963 domain-containing protein [Planctomycetaceae bacterium]
MDDLNFHLDAWRSLFPLSAVPVGERCGGRVNGLVVDPYSICFVEQMREQAALHDNLGTSVPTDVFIFAKGEPPRRDVTKIGGIPYRPAGKPWPSNSKGEPLTFVAQYCFSESTDLVGALPGDVLLVFTSFGVHGRDRSEPLLHFEWYQLGLSDLGTLTETSSPAWKFSTCYGLRHRTVDYVEKCASEAILRVIPDAVLRDEHPDEAVVNLCQIEGMKIGGMPFWPHPERIDSSALPGDFLCSLATIVISDNRPFPWANHNAPITLSEAWADESQLTWLSESILNVSIDSTSQLHWAIQLW